MYVVDYGDDVISSFLMTSRNFIRCLLSSNGNTIPYITDVLSSGRDFIVLLKASRKFFFVSLVVPTYSIVVSSNIQYKLDPSYVGNDDESCMIIIDILDCIDGSLDVVVSSSVSLA